MGQPPAHTRVETAERQGRGESWSRYNTDHTWTVIDALDAVAQETGKSAAQVAINWVRSHPMITAPILGARTLAQLQDNLEASGWQLSADQVAILNKASDVPVSYPYDAAAEQLQQSDR